MDARTTQLHTLIAYGYRQAVGSAFLQALSNLDTARAVSKCLHHAGKFGLRLQPILKIAHVIGQCRQIDAQHRLVRFLEQPLLDNLLFITKRAHHGRAGAGILMGSVFDNRRAAFEELHFLCSFLFYGGEVFAMFLPNIGDYAHRWTDNPLEFFHFARLRDARLKERQFGIGLELPNGQRYTYLRVIRFGAANNAVVVFEQFIQPFFDHRLTIGPSDAYHLAVRTKTALVCRQILQRCKRIFYENKRCSAIHISEPHIFAHHKCAHTSFKKGSNKISAIALFGAERYEQGMLCIAAELTRVGQQIVDIGIVRDTRLRMQRNCYFCKSHVYQAPSSRAFMH